MTLNPILKREAIHKGDIIFKQGEKYDHAFIIQSGEVIAKIREDGKDITIAHYGAGTIIGEHCLLSDAPLSHSYEASTETTVITISRNDFTKKLKKTENTVRSVLKHLHIKIQKLEQQSLEDAIRQANIDKEAADMVDYLIRNLSDEKKAEYAEAMLPHFNELVHVLRAVQERHRHEAQKKHLEKVKARAMGDVLEDS